MSFDYNKIKLKSIKKMANSEIYGKQRMCFYITQGERGNLRKKHRLF